uniref:Uncharacterized protein n=1 Tax=Macrostomum lignano TaxID=282301 RepID=A0A1I8J0C8_9PLAT
MLSSTKFRLPRTKKSLPSICN